MRRSDLRVPVSISFYDRPRGSPWLARRAPRGSSSRAGGQRIIGGKTGHRAGDRIQEVAQGIQLPVAGAAEQTRDGILAFAQASCQLRLRDPALLELAHDQVVRTLPVARADIAERARGDLVGPD